MWWLRGVVALGSLTGSLLGCNFPLPSGDGPDAAESDAPKRLCLEGLVSFCVEPSPTTDKVFTVNTTIDTANSPECAPLTLTSGGNLCVVLAHSITVEAGATLRAFGPRPLALVATGVLTIRGTIDVSSRRLVPAEPGAGSRTCVHERTPAADTGGAAGGAGGSMAFSGGTGGNGDLDRDGGGDVALGGLPGATTERPTTALVGGCHGQQGATGVEAGGSGGGGGGAVYLRGASVLLASGSAVRATGAGGTGGGIDAGGGGGGSGGVIYLETPLLTASGLLLATGGGGGQGGTGAGGGQSGESGDDATTTAAAAGGDLAMRGGNGGAGATDTTGNAGSPANAGGGAGGGGTGYVLYRGPALPVGTVVDAMPSMVRIPPPT